jgi:hypothetical protein
MEKKFFELPEVTFTLFEAEDVLTLSPAEEGDMPSIPW